MKNLYDIKQNELIMDRMIELDCVQVNFWR